MYRLDLGMIFSLVGRRRWIPDLMGTRPIRWGQDTEEKYLAFIDLRTVQRGRLWVGRKR